MEPGYPGSEMKDVYPQGLEVKVPADTSLPAEQVITEQSQDVKEHLTPRFVP